MPSGVNNAIARTASLAALSVIPVVSGLATAVGATEITTAFRISLVIAAVIAAAAAPICFIGLGGPVRWRRSARRLHCAVDGPPLQPDPALPRTRESLIRWADVQELIAGHPGRDDSRWVRLSRCLAPITSPVGAPRSRDGIVAPGDDVRPGGDRRFKGPADGLEGGLGVMRGVVR